VNVAATFPNLKLAMSVSATNWPTSHYKKGNVHKVQIADYMIVSKNFKSQAVGIFDPEDEKDTSR
jgi:hypothetical protein